MLRALACALCVALLAPAAARADDDVEQARALFFEGNRLGSEGKWEQARESFARSLALKRSAVTLYSLAVAQLQSGQLVEARESFRTFLGEESSEAAEPYREPARAALEELERRVPRLSIRVRPADAPGLVVRLDGKELPPARLEEDRLVNPGEHLLVASAPGHRRVERRLSIAEGTRERLELALSPETGEAVPASAPSPPSEADAEAELPVVPIVLMAAGAVAIAVGAGLGVAGVNQADEAATRDGADADAARRMGIAADVLFGLGGGTLGLGAVLLVIDLSSDASPAGASASLRWPL